MACLGPFETAPRLAVAVSGGPDSMALCLLADAWARGRGGGVLALIVDHALRPGSAEEAKRTASWLTARGIDSEILVWSGEKPASAIAATARHARYRLLADRCRARGLLHLLVGHQLEDQAETTLLRAAKGSGAAGLAGMSEVVETGCVRVLRPLLAVRRQRLRAYLARSGQDWIEDPSNRDPAFARTRARAALASLGAAAPRALATAATRFRSLRQRQDEAVAALLVRYCRLHPLGFARLEPAMLGAADEVTLDCALGRVAATVGGAAYPPAADKLARLRRHLLAGAPAVASLGRCIWRFSRSPRDQGCKGGYILVFRETRGLPPPIPIGPGATMEWDGRFVVSLDAASEVSGRSLRLEALGEGGWRQGLRFRPSLREAVPRQAALSLPALRDDLGLLAVPGFDLYRDGAEEGAVSALYRPRRSLSGSGYYLA